MDYQDFYNQLFASVEKKYGEIDDETISSIVGFSAGGPVSLCKVKDKNIFISCELAAHPDQQKSSEGIKFEFLTEDFESVADCRELMTALGDLSLQATLGDGHSINIAGLTDTNHELVSLRLFTTLEYDGDKYGIYQICA